MVITDEIRYDAYVLCKGYSLESIKRELVMINHKEKRFPRNCYCENDILVRASKETLEYAILYYHDIKNEIVDSWQNYFLSRQEKERLSL